MKITLKADYALKTVLYLALHYPVKLVQSQDIARHIGAPMKFLEQVLVALKKGGFIESRRGSTGGYQLSRSPGQITLGNVIRLIDGDIHATSRIRDRYPDNQDTEQKVLEEVWQRVTRATSDIIDNMTFEKLVSQINRQQQEPTYII